MATKLKVSSNNEAECSTVMESRSKVQIIHDDQTNCSKDPRWLRSSVVEVPALLCSCRIAKVHENVCC